ncbi:Surface polysaccharide O-acyltransferase, integral membrane enzyme [Treponema bryantii]|uniref:Surface polysaccharide O-acyltransferase, integral membrane enzyme n=1 Tax=Treponema bryantii TaxID=163 RepID=A0A1H9G2V9_9SPIR|nr:acyltransferase [Treponema bryantii]SEQ44482.1 Surface polysaccharide O-acyltransferase, integral membrane enzyme [Treponema bryantii]
MLNMEVNNNVANQSDKIRFEYITLLRVIGTFAVIGIHVVCTPVTLYGTIYSTIDLRLSVFITNLLRMFAVPLFIMISGALFLNPEKDFDLSKFLKKNVVRILTVLIIFSFIFCLLESYFNERIISISVIKIVLRNLIEGKSWAHMWFLYMLPGLYFSVPLLRPFVKNATDKEFNFTLLILFIFLSFIPTLEKKFNIKTGITIPITSIYFLYFLLGSAISHRNLFDSLKTCVTLILLPSLFILIELFIPNTIIIEDAVLKNTNASSIAAISLSIGIFSLIRNFYRNQCSVVIKFISENSFGIYLLHTIPLNICFKVLKFSPEKINLYILLLICYLFSFYFSITVTVLLRKIPIVKKYL